VVYNCKSVAKTYHQYCPVAHALDLVGERWSLLVVRELIHGPLRYSDLHERLACPTNILAARLKRLEENGIVDRRRLPPPAASTVYELTEYGDGLRSVIHALGHWGALSLGPPSDPSEMCPGWLVNALDCALTPADLTTCIEFRIDDERAWVSAGAVHAEPPAEPDAVVEGDARGLYFFLVQGDTTGLRVEGDLETIERVRGELPTTAGV
jgi:DNA-binding HxlR family transcriptional regulator